MPDPLPDPTRPALEHVPTPEARTESRPTCARVREIGRGPLPLRLPLLLARAPDGRLAVLDRPAPNRFRLSRFAADGTPQPGGAEFARGKGDTELTDPAGLAV